LHRRGGGDERGGQVDDAKSKDKIPPSMRGARFGRASLRARTQREGLGLSREERQQNNKGKGGKKREDTR